MDTKQILTELFDRIPNGKSIDAIRSKTGFDADVIYETALEKGYGLRGDDEFYQMFFDKLPPGMTTREIFDHPNSRLGSETAIYIKARKIGYNLGLKRRKQKLPNALKNRKQHEWEVFFEKLPENQTIEQVAEQAGIGHGYACSLCLKYGYKNALKKKEGKSVKKVGRPPIYDWDSVDWSMRNVDIAEILGCSESRVSQVRNKLNSPTMSPPN